MRSFAVALSSVLIFGLLILGCDSGVIHPEAEPETAQNPPPKVLSATQDWSGAQPENFVAPLSGDEVVSPVNTQARGLAKMKVNKADDELHFKLNVANIDGVIGAHIHHAPAGQNGPIVVFLFGDPFTDAVTVNGPLAEGTVTASDVVGPIAGDFEALLQAMRAGATYVQVHTLENVPGEIRGQINRGNGISPR